MESKARHHLNQDKENMVEILVRMSFNGVQKVAQNAVLIRTSDSGGRLLFQT